MIPSLRPLIEAFKNFNDYSSWAFAVMYVQEMRVDFNQFSGPFNSVRTHKVHNTFKTYIGEKLV